MAFVLSLGAATILAIGCAIYIMRLEKETRLRYDQVAAGRTELGKLSQCLVAAQEQERKSISRELHDEVGQTLNALLVDAGTSKSAFRKAMRRAGNSGLDPAACRHQHQ